MTNQDIKSALANVERLTYAQRCELAGALEERGHQTEAASVRALTTKVARVPELVRTHPGQVFVNRPGAGGRGGSAGVDGGNGGACDPRLRGMR